MAENNRDKLIRVSARLFLRSGYHGTSLDQVLEATHVAKSNFYYHFKSKDELAVAVSRYWVDWLGSEVIAPTLDDQEAGPWQRLESLFERVADQLVADDSLTGSPLGALSAELAETTPEVREVVAKCFSELEVKVADVLSTAEETWMDEGQARAVAGTIVATLEGSLLMAGIRKDPNEIRISGLVLVALIRNAWRA